MRITSLKEMRLAIFFSLLSFSSALDNCMNANEWDILQEPDKVEVNSGENVVIRCNVTGHTAKVAQMWKRFKRILSIMNEKNTIETPYKDRLSCSGNSSHFSVTMENLTVDDSDIYLCIVLTKENTEICSYGTLLTVHPPVAKVINEDIAKEEICTHSLSPTTYIITILAMLILCVAAFIYMKRKKSKEKQNSNQTTYVDMTQTIRRNTMGNSYVYNRTQNGAVPIYM